MSATEQRLSLKRFAERTLLVTVDAVRATTGLSADEIYSRIDGGELGEAPFQWVFNVAVNPLGDKRDLRLWAKEVIAPDFCDALSIDIVVDSIVPRTRQNYPSGEVLQLLCVSWPTLGQLREQIGGVAGSKFFPRDGVARWLKLRWIGNPQMKGQA